jgi:hypothetical protein
MVRKKRDAWWEMTHHIEQARKWSMKLDPIEHFKVRHLLDEILLAVMDQVLAEKDSPPQRIEQR